MSTANIKKLAHLKLVGENGNAFAILARARGALKETGREDWQEIWTRFNAEATSGDYDHLLRTCMEWFECDSEDADDFDRIFPNKEEA
ncbi:MAG: hypothetical protein JNJ45_05415 [Chthonomonas sp.]|nr:hypothetical protein [Chthonomonas sp.]